jgi:4-aminobutyrate aminotransferase/(S)-3-amino-2-methylpropionate transaminase
VGGLGGTYGGNPLAAAAALEVLSELSEGHVLQRARAIEERFFAWAGRLRRRSTLIGDARGLGGMVALELVSDVGRTPAREQTARIARRCWENGLITITAGTYGNVMRLLMPLVISDDELEEGLAVLEESILAETSKE